MNSPLDSLSNFRLLRGTVPESVEGIADCFSLKEKHFCYIGKKIFLHDYKQIELPKSLGAIFSKDMWETYQAEIKENPIYNDVAWCAIVDSVHVHLLGMSEYFYKKRYPSVNDIVDGRKLGQADVSPHADIAEGVFVGENVTIEEGVVIKPNVTISSNVTIKKNTIIYPGTVIYPYVEIGENCRIHANCSIGADGFGYHFHENRHTKIWHYGGVIIKNDVELGANVTVDSGTFRPTIVGNGCKFDNSVQIAHNCIVGDHCIVVGLSGLAGSVVIGDYSLIGGRVAVGPGSRLGKFTQVGSNTIIKENSRYNDGMKLMGDPAVEMNTWMKFQARLRMLAMKR